MKTAFQNSDQISSQRSKPKISLFVPTLDGGGAELVVLRLAQGFAERGFPVDVVLAKAEGEYLSKVPPAVQIVNLQARSPVVLFKTLALKRYLQEHQPAVLISALDIVSSATWARYLAKVSTTVVMGVHTHLSQQFRDKPEGIGGQVRSRLVRWFYPWADEIIAVSQGVAQDLAQMSGIDPEEIHVIYNPVVTPEVLQKAQESIDHPWFASGEPPVILGVGRLVRQKDFATLVRAFAQVRQQRPARLMILGNEDPREPTIKPQLETLIRELGIEADVALPGFVENPHAYMARATVFVLSSIYEGFGNVIVEALAAGTAVVATDCESGPAEILAHGEYGLLAPVGDEAAIATAILKTLDHPPDPAQLQQRSLDFTIDKVIDQYLAVLDRNLTPELAVH